MNRFLLEAPHEKYLMMKVAMIIGIAGACRRDELPNLRFEDIEDRGAVIVVNLPNTKTYTRRCFTLLMSLIEKFTGWKYSENMLN